MIRAHHPPSEDTLAAPSGPGSRPTSGAARSDGSDDEGRASGERSVGAGRARRRSRASGDRSVGAGRARRRSRPSGARTRWRRRIAEPPPPELWQRTSEPYPGAVVLEDLTRAPGDAAATQRIVARFAALRLVLLGLNGGLAKSDIAEERAIAQPYVDALSLGDAERRALDRMMAAAVSDRPRDIATHALDAADHAAHQGHEAGAYWLNRTAYTLSQPRRWSTEALRAAGAIMAAARAGRASRAARSWRRRIRRIEQANADAQPAAATDPA